MIKKIKASTSEKVIFIFILILGLFTLTSFLLLKNKCLFVKNYDPQKIDFKNPNNIAILNVGCGNVIIELYPEISPNGVERFKNLIRSFFKIDKFTLQALRRFDASESSINAKRRCSTVTCS